MKALRNIFDVVSSSSEKMETWAEEHQYLTRYYDLKEVLLQQIVNELNYCCFTIGENLYSILSGDDVVSTRVFELAQQFSIDLEQLKTRIIQIHNETAKNKQAVYLIPSAVAALETDWPWFPLVAVITPEQSGSISFRRCM